MMVVVLCQREKLLDKSDLFDFKELCRCGEEDIEDESELDTKKLGSRKVLPDRPSDSISYGNIYQTDNLDTSK